MLEIFWSGIEPIHTQVSKMWQLPVVSTGTVLFCS
jgi:hypothetical protein